jgi:hypothetical protein
MVKMYPDSRKQLRMSIGQRYYARQLQAYRQVEENGKTFYRAYTPWWSEVDAKIAAIGKLIASGDAAKKARALQ